MKRFIRLVCLAFLAVSASSATAQMRDSLLTHYIGAGVHAGYDNMFGRQPDLHDIGGAGGGLDILYKFQYRPWRFQTGLSLTSLNSFSNGAWSADAPVVSPYTTMTLHERYEDIRYARHALSLSVPLKAGFRWEDWTVLAGVRAGWPVWQTAELKGTTRTTITDEQLIDEFTDMPNHGLTTTTVAQTMSNTMGFDLAVEAEVVWSLDRYIPQQPTKKNSRNRREKQSPAPNLHYELSLFASYGVLNSGTPEEPLNSLFAGVRMAVFYEFGHPQPKKKTATKAKPKPKQPAKPKSKPKPSPKTKTVPTPVPPPQQDTILYGEQVITKGEAIVLNNLYFAVDKTDVLPSSQEALNELFSFLTSHSEVRIRITGHTDNTASQEYNLRLSRGRAEAVKQEMVKRGIDPSRIETDGKGMAEPVADNSTEQGRQQNRRVELVVL